MTDKKRAHLEAEIAEANELIWRFQFTASLGNPEAFRTVNEARERLARAAQELAAIDVAMEAE